MTEDRCERCGQVVQVGEWPWCPHGHGSLTAVPDEVPGGFWVENGFRTPQKFYSKSEHRNALEANGNVLMPVWVPNDKHLTNWAAGTVDLAGAEDFVRRYYDRPRSSPDDPPPPKLVNALVEAFR